MRTVSFFLIVLISLIALGNLTQDTAGAFPSVVTAADPEWCDSDLDGFCFIPFGADCDDADPQTYPGAEEQADLKDNNCSGFEDEPPLGFIRENYTMGGAASAVAWYGDYIYLAAMATVRVYHVPSSGAPSTGLRV